MTLPFEETIFKLKNDQMLTLPIILWSHNSSTWYNNAIRNVPIGVVIHAKMWFERGWCIRSNEIHSYTK